MNDPLLIVHPTPADEYYKKRDTPPMGWPKRREPTVEDINRAHENIRKLVAEKDRIIQQCNGLVVELQRERRWRKWITGALLATWATWIAAAKILIPYIIKCLVHQ